MNLLQPIQTPAIGVQAGALHEGGVIGGEVGDDGGHIFELADLEMETKPEDVLAEIDRLHRCALRNEKPAR